MPTELKSLPCKASYPSAYRTLLKKTDAEIQAKLTQAFQTLFYGNPSTQRIYVTASGTTTASIPDTLHRGEVRSEGLGLGMLACVMLDRPDEFDALWRYATTNLEFKSGPLKGYFDSMCDIDDSVSYHCVDPYGYQQFIMALLLAKQRWGTVAGRPDYAADALRLLVLLRSTIENNGGIVDGVTNSFDSNTKLIYDVPNNGGAPFLRTSLAVPGYYDVWAVVTGDPFYAEAAASARRLLTAVAHPTTGLLPLAANFDGTPKSGSDRFAAESFRNLLHFAIDQQWGEPSAADAGWQVPIIDNLLAFFSKQGLYTYSSAFTLEGDPIPPIQRATELVMANGAIAAFSTESNASAFVQAAWDLPPPEGPIRYYAGLFYLIGNLLLAGEFRLCP